MTKLPEPGDYIRVRGRTRPWLWAVVKRVEPGLHHECCCIMEIQVRYLLFVYTALLYRRHGHLDTAPESVARMVWRWPEEDPEVCTERPAVGGW